MELALLALLGVGLMAEVFSDSGTHEADEPDPEPEDVEAVLADGEDITTGGGDDTITGSGGTISTGAGDDVIDMEYQDRVNAGSGDDLISVRGSREVIEGDDGDDTISGEIRNDADFYGGNGDDLLKLTTLNSAHGASVDGGTGDDRFEIHVPYPNEYHASTKLTGGEGADAFLLDIERPDLIETEAFPNNISKFDPIWITDFNSSEDTLEITLSDVGPVIANPFPQADFVDLEVIEDANGSQVILNLAQAYSDPDAGDGTQMGQLIIRLPGATGIDPSMIRVLVEA